jgi:DNA-binding response OmpR family regulator
VDYLAKPLTRDVLLERVGEALGRHERRGQAAHHDDAASPKRLASQAGAPGFESIPIVLRDVLVVEDDPVFRGFLRDVLAGGGLTVHEAEDGRQALKVALERRPWLILTEVAMKGGDGFELCRQVRAHSLLRQTPLVFLSASDDYKYRSHGLGLGADDFLPKDTPIRELLMRVLLLLERRIGLGAAGKAGSAMAGQIAVIGAPGMLQVCHLMQLSGVLLAHDGSRGASIRFRAGEILGAELDGKRDAAAVTSLLAWEHGSFEFHPGDPGSGARLVESFEELLLEGCRMLDEGRRS